MQVNRLERERMCVLELFKNSAYTIKHVNNVMYKGNNGGKPNENKQQQKTSEHFRNFSDTYLSADSQ